MKPFLKVLTHIQRWPEGTRRFAMLGCLFFAALAVFVSWSYLTSSRLSKISDGDFYVVPDLPAELETQEESLNSPLSGMFESFAFLGDKISSVSPRENAASLYEFFTNFPSEIMKRMNSAADWAAEKLR